MRKIDFSGVAHRLERWMCLYLPLTVCYWELVFKLSSVGGIFRYGTLVTALFSLSFGALLYLPCAISSRPKLNRGITIGLLAGVPLIYLVEFFVNRQFKLFYDLATVTGGAGDVAGGFLGDALKLIFSFDGLLHILLFYLPLIAYCTVFRRVDQGRRLRLHQTAVVAGFLLVTFGLGRGAVALQQQTRLSYGKEYNFQTAVSSFGLITAVRLDLQELLFGDSGTVGFEVAPTFPPLTTQAPVTEPEETTTAPLTTEPAQPGEPTEEPTTTEEPVTEPEPIVYEDNVLDIDFAALSEVGGQLGELDLYVAGLGPSSQTEYTGLFAGKNLIFITAEAFAAEAIDPELTPTLYRLATKGINFTDYYQFSGAGTTGGEYQNLFGLLATDGGMSFKNTSDRTNYMTISYQLNELGYYGKAFHNNDYQYYSRHETHTNLGFSDGFMGWGNGMEEFLTNQWPQSDLEMFQGTLPTYIDKQPFSVYYMTVSGHSNYTYGANDCADQNWDRVRHLDASEKVRGYLAAQLELEDALTYLVQTLEEAGIADDTVIVVASDHFPYGLDNDGYLGNMPSLSELYGYWVWNNLQRDHNRLILWSGCLEDEAPIVVDSPVSSIDILPTLLNLFGIAFDSRLLPGRDVLSDAPALVFDLAYDWKTDLGEYSAVTNTFTPAREDLEIPEGYVDAMKAIVRNKVLYCEKVLDLDYFGHIFGRE